jgi:hypothetical protein
MSSNRPQFFQHTLATTSTSHAKFHTYPILQAPITQPIHLFGDPFRAECQNYFSSTKLQTKHSLQSFSYIFNCQWSISSFFWHSMPHLQFQTLYGTIHRSNTVLAVWPLSFQISQISCHNSLCMYLLTFHMLMTIWLIRAHLFCHFSVPACPLVRLLS